MVGAILMIWFFVHILRKDFTKKMGLLVLWFAIGVCIISLSGVLPKVNVTLKEEKLVIPEGQSYMVGLSKEADKKRYLNYMVMENGKNVSKSVENVKSTVVKDGKNKIEIQKRTYKNVWMRVFIPNVFPEKAYVIHIERHGIQLI